MKAEDIITVTAALLVAGLVGSWSKDPVVSTPTSAQAVLYCSGTVRYLSGAPAPGVRVEYYPGRHGLARQYTEARTDAHGRYEIIGPEDTPVFDSMNDETNVVMARAAEGNLAAIQAFDMATTHIDLVLQPALTLSGSVKDTQGAPIVGAAVDLGLVVGSPGGFTVRLLEAQPTKVNALGQFSVPALPQGCGYYIERIVAKGYGSGYARVEAKNTQTNRYEFPAFVLKRADRKIAGRVLDEAGNPLAGAEVDFGGPGQPVNYMGLGKGVNSTNTDSEGWFHFDAVCDTPLMLHASYRDPLDQSNSRWLNGGGLPARPGDTNIVIRLPAPNKGK